VLLEGLRALIESQHDMAWAGGLTTAEDLWRHAVSLEADIIILDIQLPGPDPFEAMDDVRKNLLAARVLVYSAYVREYYVDAAVQSGAWGYLSKLDPTVSLLDAIRKAARGEFVYSDDVVRMMSTFTTSPAGILTESKPPTTLWKSLTPREQQILRLIGRGLDRAQIAEQIARSPNTITGHLQSIMKKLGMSNRVELVRYAIREGLADA
jgi:DNA-binding NarL/FixJ family response regulator